MDQSNGVWGTERFRLTLSIIIVITAISIDSLGIAPVLPTAVKELQGTDLFGWAFGSFMLAWLVGTIYGGLLADARGPRLPIIIGLGLFALGLLVAGIAQSMPQFLAGRVLQGAGGGIMLATTYVIVARAYSDRLRARVMALMASAWILPALAAPALSGVVAEWLSWRIVFFLIIPITLIAAWMLLPALRTLDIDSRPMDWRPVRLASLIAIGMGLMLASSSFIDTFYLVIILLISGGLLLFPALHTLMPAGTFYAKPGLPAGLASRGLLAFGFYGAEAFIPLSLGEVYQVNMIQAGIALSAGAVGWIIAAWGLERVEAKGNTGKRQAAVLYGFALLAVGIFIVCCTLLLSLPLLILVVGWAIGGAGVGLAYTAGSLLCFAQVEQGKEGEVSGQLQVIEALMGALATGLGGAVLARLKMDAVLLDYSHAVVFGIMLFAAILGSVIAFRGLSRERLT